MQVVSPLPERRPAPSLLARMARVGAAPGDSDELRAQKAIVMVAVPLVIVQFLAVNGPVYIAFGEPLAGLAYIGYAIYALFQWLWFGWGHRNLERLIFFLAVLALPSHLLVALLLGGLAASAGLPLWGLAFPVVVVVMFYGTRRALPWFAGYLFVIAASIYLQPWLRPSNNLPPLVAQTLLAVNIAAVSTLVLAVLAYLSRQRDLAYRLLRVEQEKAEALLLNILPENIASILKNNTRTIAEHFDGATILFADVVNFTPLSAQMSPTALVELLNEVFSQFDLQVEQYGVEKIKTIGDCYMVAAGVPCRRPDHAQVLARLALAMREHVNSHTFGGQRLQFRIGLNSGPVIAGVIGRKKFIYDLWGDAVNTASRMELHGAGGNIQLTRATYELIKDEFICEFRGSVQVKGKGEMETFFLLGAR